MAKFCVFWRARTTAANFSNFHFVLNAGITFFLHRCDRVQRFRYHVLPCQSVHRIPTWKHWSNFIFRINITYLFQISGITPSWHLLKVSMSYTRVKEARSWRKDINLAVWQLIEIIEFATFTPKCDWYLFILWFFWSLSRPLNAYLVFVPSCCLIFVRGQRRGPRSP